MQQVVADVPARQGEVRSSREAASHTATWVAVVLGLFYIASGIGKLANVGGFLETVEAFGVPHTAALVAVILPPLEVLIGLAFVMGIATRRLAVLSTLLLFFFTAAFAFGHFVLGVDDCGCFGELSALSTSPSVTFLRNVLLIAGSVYVWKRGHPDAGTWPRWKQLTILVVGAVVFTASGISAYRPFYATAGDSGPALQGAVANTPLADVFTASPDSTYLLFFYGMTCTHCWNAVENVKAYQQFGTADRVIGFTAGSDSALASFNAKFEANFPSRLISADAFRAVTGVIPTAVYVRDGNIVNVQEHSIIAPATFEQAFGRRPPR